MRLKNKESESAFVTKLTIANAAIKNSLKVKSWSSLHIFGSFWLQKQDIWRHIEKIFFIKST